MISFYECHLYRSLTSARHSAEAHGEGLLGATEETENEVSEL